MVRKLVSKDVIRLLTKVTEDLLTSPQFDGVDKIVVIVSKPIPGQKDCGLSTVYSNAKPIEIMSICDNIAEEISDSLECQCSKCVAEREAGNAPVVH